MSVQDKAMQMKLDGSKYSDLTFTSDCIIFIYVVFKAQGSVDETYSLRFYHFFSLL